jgi:hypothetical protein
VTTYEVSLRRRSYFIDRDVVVADSTHALSTVMERFQGGIYSDAKWNYIESDTQFQLEGMNGKSTDFEEIRKAFARQAAVEYVKNAIRSIGDYEVAAILAAELNTAIDGELRAKEPAHLKQLLKDGKS